MRSSSRTISDSGLMIAFNSCALSFFCLVHFVYWSFFFFFSKNFQVLLPSGTVDLV